MPLQFWMEYENIDIFHINETAYTYQTNYVSLDADGSPRAYHPNNTGIDNNLNAGYPNKGWRSVLVADPNNSNQPYVQPNGPNAGYFVSKTSLQDITLPETDPAKYVDSEQYPYLVFPGSFYAIKGTGNWGDIAMARSIATGLSSVAIVADGGPTKAPLREMSLKLATELGGNNPNPRTGAGAPHGMIQYIIFPTSRASPKWRRSLPEIQAQGQALLNAIGGWPQI